MQKKQVLFIGKVPLDYNSVLLPSGIKKYDKATNLKIQRHYIKMGIHMFKFKLWQRMSLESKAVFMVILSHQNNGESYPLLLNTIKEESNW